jgi:hypothetical protein
MIEQKEESGSAPESDELSLIDLAAVVLRYRRLVIALPAIVTVLVGLYLYALPKMGFNVKKSYTVELSASLKTFPGDVQNRVSVDIVQSLNAYFTSVPVQAQAYAKCFPKEVQGLDKVQLSTFVRDEVLAKRFVCGYSPESRRYSLTLKSRDIDAADRYLSLLWSEGLGVLRDRLKGAFFTSLGLIDRDLSVYDSSKSLDAGADGKANLLNIRERILGYQDEPQFPVDDEPYHAAYLKDGVSGGRAKKLVLAFFASFFVALLVAFCLNAIDRVKRDPEAMGKLRRAMHS